MPLANDLLQKMLSAAEGAVGSEWGTFSGDIAAFAQNLLADSAQTARDFESGAITQGQAKVQFDGIADATAMLANYSDQALKQAAQDALNAAIGVLWAAILALRP
jgi:hypothetical protein